MLRFTLSTIVALSLAACAQSTADRFFEDNATKLAFNIEEKVKLLRITNDGTENVVFYEPVSNRKYPCTIILLPEMLISADDLVAKGVPGSIADKIFRDLNYIDVRKGNLIIVYQNGKINFTRYGTHLVKIEEIFVKNSYGESKVVLRNVMGEILVVGLE